MAETRLARRVRVPTRGTALLLIDVINDLDFEGAEPLIARAEAMAPGLLRFKRRAERAGVPVIYVNDNFGRWRSDFRQTVAHCTRARSPGRGAARVLRPGPRDYFVLKPMHSGFYDTTLDTLLEALRVRRLILTGIAGNICVLFTANDAYMRGFELYVASDCVVSEVAAVNAIILEQMQTVLKAVVRPSTELRLTAPSRSRRTRPGSGR